MKIKYGKLGIELLIIAVMSAVILGVVNYTLGMITSTSVVYKFLIAVVSVVFFSFILKLHPGKENFLEVIPIVILSASIIELLRTWFPIIPGITTEFSWINLAFLISAIYLSDIIVKKYILK